MLVEVIRLETSKYGTLGAIRINGQVFGCSLEPPYMENRVNVSNIPTGQYWMRKYDSPKHGLVWQVKDVPGRSFIEFHPGNIAEHTAGCFLVGESEAKLRGPADHTRLINSGRTFDRFMAALGADGDKYHRLTVREAY